MADGFTFNSLLTSISGAGSSSADLVNKTLTGNKSRTIPLVNYNDFSSHIFFGNAIRRFNTAYNEIINKYPIGLFGLSAGTELQTNPVIGSKAIFEVDNFRKSADGFTLFILDRLAATGSASANLDSEPNATLIAKNDRGENVEIVAVYRNNLNALTGEQAIVAEDISNRARLFEEEQLDTIYKTPGVAVEIIGTSTGTYRSEVSYAATAEETITRSEKLENLLPSVLFDQDDTDVLSRLLAAYGDIIDDLKIFIDQIPNTKTLDYGNYNRIPNKLIPLFLSSQFGVDVYENAKKSSFEKSLINAAATGFTTQQITYEIWNRIANNISHLIKTKGTRETIESIGRIYGVDSNFLKTNEYSIFYKPTLVREVEEVDTPTLFSDGTKYVQTTANSATGSALVFDIPANTNFTIEMRVSATGFSEGSTGHTLLVHPLYSIELNPYGQVAFRSTASSSFFAQTEMSNLSGYVRGYGGPDNFLNVAVSRSGDFINVYAMALSSSPTGGNDYVVVNKKTISTADVPGNIWKANFSSSGGIGAAINLDGTDYSQFPAYFPGTGDTRFTGYLHQVRKWNVALKDEDIKDHVRNFESISVNSSTATDIVNGVDNTASFGGLSAHYKLKENVILSGDFNFIVDSTTASNTALPINFGEQKRYRVFQDMKKINYYYPVGLAADNDRIRQDDTQDGVQDSGFVSFSLNPINAVNRAIKNLDASVAPTELLGDGEDLFRKEYGGDFKKRWHEIARAFGLGNEAEISSDPLENELIKRGASVLGSGISGVSGNTASLVDLNTFIKGMGNFNDTFGGLFSFAKQFLPAKTNIIGEGIFIENHMFERPKMRRQFGFRESTATGYVGAPTSSGNLGHISYDEGRSEYNQTPSIIAIEPEVFTINNHNYAGDLAEQGSNSGNERSLIASAATTAVFQGYRVEDSVQDFFEKSVESGRAVPSLTDNSSRSVPRFSPTRVGRVLPVKITPAAGPVSVIDVTLDTLLISPTAAPIESNIRSLIKGTARLLTKGRSFKTDQPSLRFEFPASSDGTNLFEATVGNISQGKGRLIKDKDTTITTTLEDEKIEFELRLADVVRSLTSENASRSVSINAVDESISGSIGIVPIRVVNLFNNNTQIFRVAINSDETRDQDFLRQLSEQGGEQVSS